MSGQPKRRQVVERLESLGGIEWLCEQIKALLDTADEQSTAAIRKARFRADYRKWYASALVDRYQRFKFLLPVLLLAGCASDEQVTRRGWELVWADEFDGTLIDQDSWTPLVMPDPHNEELQYYTDRVDAELGANVWLADGALVIEARRKDFEHRRYTSARLNTKGKREFLYGRFEARIRQPGEVGMWPAFWMLGGNIDEVGWPACGEIDIMEGKGRLPTWTSGALHRGPDPAGDKITSAEYELPEGDFHHEWHLFAVE